MSDTNNNWSFSNVWNEALDAMPERGIEPRDYIWASELGRGMYDRYHKMHGRKATTPPNLRARRKFEAGNLTEWVLQQVLARAGVLKSTQERIYYRDGAMVVSGRCDYMAGGMVQELDEVFLEGLPESFIAIAQVAIAHLKERFPNGLREQGIELKSCAAIMFDRYLEAPGQHHALQAFHYAHNQRQPYILEYVSRDDLRMCSWVILPDSEKWQKLYDADITRMAEVYKMSPEEVEAEVKEPLLNYDEKTGKFKKNFEVEYSLYLTDYGFEYPEQYAKPAQSYSLRLSNVIKKIRAEAKLTKINYKTMAEGFQFFPAAKPIFLELGIDESLLPEVEAFKPPQLEPVAEETEE